MMLENERLVKKFANATKDSKVVFMTCSGSGGMEAAIINCLTPQDKALVINGVALVSVLWNCLPFIKFLLRKLSLSMVEL